MKRRFQFSLGAAIVMTLLASAALGIYIRRPYYLAEQKLDAAMDGKKAFPGWPAVKNALIDCDSFRETAATSETPFFVSPPEQIHGSAYCRVECLQCGISWAIEVEEQGGNWVAMNVKREMIFIY